VILRLILLLSLMSCVGATQAAFFSDDEARQKVKEVQQQVTQLQSQNAALQTRLDEELKQRQAAEGRIAALETQLKSQGLVDLLNQIERLNAEIGKLKGQLEVMTHDIEVTQKRQRDLYTDLDGRLRKLETAPATPAAAPTATAPVAAPAAATTPAPQQAASSPAPAANPPAPVTAAPATPAAPVDSAAELKSYEAAHNQFRSGEYKEAADAFEKFLDAYPTSKYAPSAQYWIGYAHFSRKNYKAAIASQQKLIKMYPDNHKVPDAMYNIANSQIQMAEVDAARQTLRSLIEKYPTSDAASLAKKRLTVLESIKPRN
jgi:tol-pal system protein YbgF